MVLLCTSAVAFSRVQKRQIHGRCTGATTTAAATGGAGSAVFMFMFPHTSQYVFVAALTSVHIEHAHSFSGCVGTCG